MNTDSFIIVYGTPDCVVLDIAPLSSIVLIQKCQYGLHILEKIDILIKTGFKNSVNTMSL